MRYSRFRLDIKSIVHDDEITVCIVFVLVI